MPRRLLPTLAALLIAAFAGLVLTKTLPYYTFEKGIHFLATKSGLPSKQVGNGRKPANSLNAKVVGRNLLAK